MEHAAIFYGVEQIKEEYKIKCQTLGVPFYAVQKAPGYDASAGKEFANHLKIIKPDVILLHSINLIPQVLKYARAYKVRVICVEHTPNEVKTKAEWVY
ncbi:MAG TPA: hypothetical protein VD794_01800, partial [Flavisolibacter sp.]|nr:hypothetical protein [Flavisolibacter sp.]